MTLQAFMQWQVIKLQRQLNRHAFQPAPKLRPVVEDVTPPPMKLGDRVSTITSVKPPKRLEDQPHGTFNTYKRHRCRCHPCTIAYRLRLRADRQKYLARRRAKEVAQITLGYQEASA